MIRLQKDKNFDATATIVVADVLKFLLIKVNSDKQSENDYMFSSSVQ
jgi:hypothetical protein